MSIRELTPEVLVADTPVLEVDAATIDLLHARLASAPRGRIRLCAHRSPDDPLHEMLIALRRDSYIRPHRHAGKTESFHVIEGTVDVLLMDEAGEVTRVVELGDPSTGRAFYYRLSDSRFHTLLIRSERLVIHETTSGPFRPGDSELASWAPPESDAGAARQYLSRLEETVRGMHVGGSEPGERVDRSHTLVVGGTRGIGRSIALLLRRLGHSVTVVGRRPPENGGQSDGIRVIGADLLESAERVAVLDQVTAGGPLTNMVFVQRFRGEAAGRWSGEIETGLTATKDLIEAAVAQSTSLRAIVGVSSTAGSFVSTDQDLAYHVVKAGLEHLIRYYAVVLGPRGIRVNAVAPGIVVKPENEEHYRREPRLVEVLSAPIPLGRLGRVEDVAAAVEFLCSSRASFITGHVLTVDGGATLLAQQSLARSLSIQLDAADE